MPAPIDELFEPDEFTRRHLGPSPAEVDEMLRVLDVDSVAELLDQTMPETIRSGEPLDLPGGVPEQEALRRAGRAARPTGSCPASSGRGGR